MSDPAQTSSWSLSSEQARYVDQVCTTFEGAWKAGTGRRSNRCWPRPRRTLYPPCCIICWPSSWPTGASRGSCRPWQRYPSDGSPTTPPRFAAFEAAGTHAPPTLPPDPFATHQPRGTAAPPTGEATEETVIQLPTMPGYEILAGSVAAAWASSTRPGSSNAEPARGLKMILAGSLAGPEERGALPAEAEAVARLAAPEHRADPRDRRARRPAVLRPGVCVEGGSLDRKSAAEGRCPPGRPPS